MQGMILFAMLGGELLVQYRITFARSGRATRRPRRGRRREQQHRRRRARLGRRVRHAAALRRARRAARRALGRAQPRRRGDDARRRRDGLSAPSSGSAARPASCCPLAIAVAALAGGAVALILAFLVITLRANQIVSGLALTIFCRRGRAVVVPRQRLQPRRQSGAVLVRGGQRLRPRTTCPSSGPSSSRRPGSSTPRGSASSSSRYYLSRTRPGLNVRAVGESPAAADAMGISVTRYRYAPHARRRRVRGRRRRVLQPRADARLGRRAHRRRRLDRDRARHLRVLARRPLPRRRVRLRRLLGAPVHAAGARGDDRARSSSRRCRT